MSQPTNILSTAETVPSCDSVPNDTVSSQASNPASPQSSNPASPQASKPISLQLPPNHSSPTSLQTVVSDLSSSHSEDSYPLLTIPSLPQASNTASPAPSNHSLTSSHPTAPAEAGSSP